MKKEAKIDEICQGLLTARSVIFVPGFGMATSQAQHSVSNLAKALKKMGKLVRFCIHPVAGRLPGHMNVLLAEANVPYDMVEEMDKINPEFKKTDVAIIIGANDTCNSDAFFH